MTEIEGSLPLVAPYVGPRTAKRGRFWIIKLHFVTFVSAMADGLNASKGLPEIERK